MAKTKDATPAPAAPNDDIERGNVGTGDQGPYDVYPSDRQGAGGGEMSPGGIKEDRRSGKRAKTTRP